MEFQGMVKFVGDVEKVSDTLTKQTFVVEEMQGQYPASMAIDMLNEKVELLKDVIPGDVVKVSVNFRSNESTTTPGKHFTSINGWKLTKIAKSAAEAKATEEAPAVEGEVVTE